MPHARKDKITWVPGHYYHIYNRGARRLAIFREAQNYLFALSRIKKYCRELDLSLIAYCLMPTHYHFLTRQDSDHNAGLLAQRVFNSYSKAYNKMYEHSGTLFESRYHSKHVDSDTYLRHLCRYIHINPVKDGLVDDPADWPYSNYRDWLGLRPGTLLDRQFVNDTFPDLDDYQTFVRDFMEARPVELEYLAEFER